MKTRGSRPIRWGLFAIAIMWMLAVVPFSAMAAPYAGYVIDARTGEVLYSDNAGTRLHPASLTKMMTLYIAFEAIEHGEISLDTPITISKHAASEPYGLNLRAGQRINLRYLIRAAAVRSDNGAATAIGEAIEGSEAQFARRMNRTAKAIGMTNTTFKNAHGLTQSGHLSTARDMTLLGRQLFYDFPDYYNLFSRVTANVNGTKVYHTNRRLLNSYNGADGIKTGYTDAAGFTIVASARRGGKHIIATVFGGKSTASRNAQVVKLFELGFRETPTRVAVNRPARPPYMGKAGATTTRVASAAAVKKSLRPRMRPMAEAETIQIAENASEDITKALIAAQGAKVEEAPDSAESTKLAAAETAADPALASVTPKIRPASLGGAAQARQSNSGETVLRVAAEPDAIDAAVQEVVTRVSTSGGRHWGINVGSYPNAYEARKVLLKTALSEISTLDGSLRKVVRSNKGFDANFMGLSAETAQLACRRLKAKNLTCHEIGPG